VLRKLTKYLKQADESTADQFTKVNPDPVLLVPPFRDAGSSVFTQILAVEGEGSLYAGSGEVSVAVIQKRVGANPFGSFITVGRAINNDIVVNEANISKVHAYFLRDPAGNYLVRDAGSTNGTTINGNPVGTTNPVMLNSKDVIILGKRLATTFLSPADFYAFLID